MPELEKLHQRWKSKPDRMVLTISADSPGPFPAQFISENHYTLPVINSREVAEKFFPGASYPQNWLLDPEGRRLDFPAPRPYESIFGQLDELAAKVAKKRP